MFLRTYVELNLPIAEVEEALLRAPTEWIPRLASSAEEHGDQLLAEVGFPVSGVQFGKRVEIELGPPVRTQGRTWLPVTWRATGPRGIFPTLEGELEVAALGPHLTQLGLSARYKPPFGLVGESFDRALLHRVAEATVRDFVERVAGVLRVGAEGPVPKLQVITRSGPSVLNGSAGARQDGIEANFQMR